VNKFCYLLNYDFSQFLPFEIITGKEFSRLEIENKISPYLQSEMRSAQTLFDDLLFCLKINGDISSLFFHQQMIIS